MSVLNPYVANRTRAKLRLEHGFRRVNDFYWAVRLSSRFAQEPSQQAALNTFVSTDPDLQRQGRLSAARLPDLWPNVEQGIYAFGVIVLFSFFEPYLRDVLITAVLANPACIGNTSAINGEAIAGDEALLAALETLAYPTVDRMLTGPYKQRFASIAKVFGDPVKKTVAPYSGIVDEYYAKRNCLIHNDGVIDARAHRFFASDSRNPAGGRVVVDFADYLRLHKAIHGLSDAFDAFMMQTHIRNAEALRAIRQYMRANPKCTAKDVSRFVLESGMGTVSRNVLARALGLRET